MTHLPITITLFSHNDEGDPAEPFGLLAPVIARLRRDGLLLEGTALTVRVTGGTGKSYSTVLQTTITVDEPASAFETAASRAVLALQILTATTGARKGV